MAGIWIYADKYQYIMELITAGRELANKLDAELTVLASGDTGTADNLIACGADEVMLLPELPAGQPVQDFVPVIADQAVLSQPDIFLIAATPVGKEMAARIAARLDTGLCSECTSLHIDESGILLMERMNFGGAVVQTVKSLAKPQMVTIPPRTYQGAVPIAGRQGKTMLLETPKSSGIQILENKAKSRSAGDIGNARIIVCAGRGIENEENLDMLRELADVLGAELACTRPISEEKHWLNEDQCIGLSAREVKPDLYIGIGVSGQIQHVIGIKDAGLVCAINSDENAPFFKSADYGIIGDLYQIVPALIKELRAE